MADAPKPPDAPAAPPPTPRVPVRLADGTIGTVPRESLDSALSSGAQVLSASDAQYEKDQAKYGDISGRLANVGLTVASDLSLGAADYAAAETLGKDYVAGVRRANPLSGLVGHGLAMVVPEIVTAGAWTPLGLAGRAGAGAEGLIAGESILSKGLGFAARGAIEGGAMGAGDAISEAALGDEGLTAEKLLAGAGHGALAGGVLGFGLGAGGAALARGTGALRRGAVDLLSGGAGKIAGETGAELAEKYGGRYAYAATGARKAEYTALEKMGVNPEDLGNWLMDNWSKYSDKSWNFASAEDRHLAVQAMKKEYGEAVGGAIRSLDVEAKAAAKAELSPLTGARSFVDRAEKEIVEKLAGNPLMQKEAAHVQDLINKVKDAAGIAATDEQIAGLRAIARSGTADAEKAAAKIADIEEKQASLTWEKLHEWRGTLDSKVNWVGSEKAINEALKDMRGVLEDGISQAASKAQVGGEYAAAKGGYRKAALLEEATEHGVAKQGGNRVLGLSEQLGIIGGLMTGNPLVGLAGAGIQYGVKHYGDQVMASVLKKASTLEAMKRAVLVTDGVKDTAIKSFFNKTSATLRSAPVRTERIVERLQAVQRQATVSPVDDRDPHAPDPLVAPKTSMAYQQTKQNAVQWLASQAPKGAPRSLLVPTLRLPPTKAELLAWNAKADVFEDPIGTIGYAMKTGTLRADHVDALDAMYPKLAEDLRRSFHQALISVTSRSDLPNSTKLRQLGILLRTPATPDQEPQFIAAQQAAYAEQQEQKPPPPPPKAGRHEGSSLATGEDVLE